MARSLKSVFIVPELNESMLDSKTKGALVPCSSNKAKSKGCSVLNNAFMGESVALDEKGLGYCSSKASSSVPVHVCCTFVFWVSKPFFFPTVLYYFILLYIYFRRKQQLLLARV